MCVVQVLHLYASNHPAKLLCSPNGIIDILTIFPTYVLVRATAYRCKPPASWGSV